MERIMKTKKQQHLLLVFSLVFFSSCLEIFEEKCPVDHHVHFAFLGESGKDETNLFIHNVTDYIFNADSILFRVDSDIRGDRIRTRSMDLPDGDWIIVSFANLSLHSRLSPYSVGRTHLKDLVVEVVNPKLARPDTPGYLGNSDKLYYSSLKLQVSNGSPTASHRVIYAPAHSQMTLYVTWENESQKPVDDGNLAIILHGIAGGCRFLSAPKIDKVYNIPYSIPYSLAGDKEQRVRVYKSDDTFRSDIVSMRYESGQAPSIQLMNASTPLSKPLDLNEFFKANNIDLSNLRLQNFQLSIRVQESTIVISPIEILPWDIEYI